MHGLEAQYSGQIDFIYLDIDDRATNPLKGEFGYQYQPHLFLLDGEGNIVMQWVGPVEAADLEAAFAAVLP